MLILVPTAFEASLLWSDAVAARLRNGEMASVEIGGREARTAICGFGLAAAGVGAAYWLGQACGVERPREEPENGNVDAILVGLAGAYDEVRAPIGSAMIATATTCWGIGAGEGESLISAEDLGWHQGHPLAGVRMVGDRMPLAAPGLAGMNGTIQGEILSVAASAATREQAECRARRHPAALAEEMEGYSVALAARLLGRRVSVIRGLCNRVGDREKENWCIHEAMDAARELLEKFTAGLPA